MFVWTEQLPATANRISLSDRIDRFGMPLAQVEWRPIPSDETTLGATIRKLRSYWDRHHLDRLCRLRWTPEASDDTLSVADLATEVFHPSGTTRMGRDSRSSVVDPDELRCHRSQTSGLSVRRCFRLPAAPGGPHPPSIGNTCGLSASRHSLEADPITETRCARRSHVQPWEKGRQIQRIQWWHGLQRYADIRRPDRDSGHVARDGIRICRADICPPGPVFKQPDPAPPPTWLEEPG